MDGGPYSPKHNKLRLTAIGEVACSVEPFQQQPLSTGMESEVPSTVLTRDLQEAVTVTKQRGKKLLKTGNWSDQQLRVALRAVDQGYPLSTVTLDYGI